MNHVDHRPLISVLMPVYNGEAYVREAILSIVQQTYPFWELVIVDDGSTDGTAELLGKLSALDSRIKVFRKENEGLTRALNFGLELCQGVYIARQDADDISEPYRLDSLSEAVLKNQHRVIVSGWCVFEDGDLERSWASEVNAWMPTVLRARLLRWTNLYVHGTLLIEKKFLEELGGYDTSFRMSQDYDLFLRAQEKEPIAYLPGSLYRLRRHRDSIGRRHLVEQTRYAAAAALIQSLRDSGRHDRVAQLRHAIAGGLHGTDMMSLLKTESERRNISFWFRCFDFRLSFLARKKREPLYQE